MKIEVSIEEFKRLKRIEGREYYWPERASGALAILKIAEQKPEIYDPVRPETLLESEETPRWR